MNIRLKKRGVLPVQNMKKSTLLYRSQCEYGYVYILKAFREKKMLSFEYIQAASDPSLSFAAAISATAEWVLKSLDAQKVA